MWAIWTISVTLRFFSEYQYFLSLFRWINLLRNTYLNLRFLNVMYLFNHFLRVHITIFITCSTYLVHNYHSWYPPVQYLFSITIFITCSTYLFSHLHNSTYPSPVVLTCSVPVQSSTLAVVPTCSVIFSIIVHIHHPWYPPVQYLFSHLLYLWYLPVQSSSPYNTSL